jgi:DNA replication protein DnaC
MTTNPRHPSDSVLTGVLDAAMADLLSQVRSLPTTPDQWDAFDRRAMEAEGRRLATESAAQRRSRAKVMRELGGFPRRPVEDAAVARHDVAALQQLAAWEPERRNIAVLSGPTGCGKTVAATWWMLTRSPRENVGFLRAVDFAAGSRYDRDERRHLERAGLVLDDLGCEYADSAGNVRTDLESLLDMFHADRRPLIITTNLTAAAFAIRYGERCADRLAGSGHWMSLNGKSLRC